MRGAVLAWAAVLAAVVAVAALSGAAASEAELEAQTFGMAEGRPARCNRGTQCPSTCCGGYCCPGTCAKRGPFGKVQCGNTRVVHKRPRYYRSCAEIKSRNKAARSGVHMIEPRQGHVWTVYCDMTTMGGGWTSLLNPRSFPNYAAPGFMIQSRVLSGTDSAKGTDTIVPRGAWNAIRRYNNGNVVAQSTYSWPNAIKASDVLVQATVQGQNESRMFINGKVAPAVRRKDKWGAIGSQVTNRRLARFNAMPRTRNAWWRTFQSGRNPGYFAKDAIKGKGQLSITVRAGRACQPNCQHGTGWNIQRIYVR